MLEKDMHHAAQEHNFEKAIALRDEITDLKKKYNV
jgi:excinuclease UvrABC helicase subunit UvrB